MCSIPGTDGVDTHFDELRKWVIIHKHTNCVFITHSALFHNHTYLLFLAILKQTYYVFVYVCITEDIFMVPTRDEKNPKVYGVFTTTRYCFFALTLRIQVRLQVWI